MDIDMRLKSLNGGQSPMLPLILISDVLGLIQILVSKEAVKHYKLFYNSG